MSKFGLYYFGYCLVLAAQFIMKSIFVANKLGEPFMALPVTKMSVFGPLVVLIILEIAVAIITAALKGE